MLGFLIDGALEFDYQQGAPIVEAHPTATDSASGSDSRCMGILNACLAAGFAQAARGGTKAILRKYLK